MKREFTPARLDVSAFAEAAATLSGSDPLTRYTRLGAELADPAADAVVQWEATGQERTGAGGNAVPWLHLAAETVVPLVCQRCLAPVDIALQVDRWFRFVADEETAAVEDENSEEDVLVGGRDFDLAALIEDELLMDLPITPTHEVCPEPVQLSAVDPAFDQALEAKPNPFAALDALRPRKSE
ncbi:YceD family protein [Variovorax ginsengisoli]|uniref:Large ribosomal RNA subunit accumulation protein YceD n=1 Tax=Variovorax ginsengisoli TaxID=363844 RepID=A0ABT9S0B0_9BURK|nr:DUF177 domain-containing protein [Variovorax ginsengisoli]MDP9897795.1 uncharacterized protein [Variovorax ginsengisoli]